jgi:hypothetical protein
MQTIHMVLDVRGALNWPKKRLLHMFLNDAGKPATADEAREVLLDHLQQNHRFLPIGKPCDGFTYEKGFRDQEVTRPSTGRLGGDGFEQ